MDKDIDPNVVFDDEFDKAEQIKPTGLSTADNPAIETPPELPTEPPVPPEPPPEELPPQPPPVDYEQKWKSLDGIVRKKDEEISTIKKQYEEQIAELKGKVPPPAEKIDEPAAPVTPPISITELLSKVNLTDEQKAQLAEYEEEFDLVSKFEGIKREKAAEALYNRLKAEFKEEIASFEKKFQTQLEPTKAFIDESRKAGEEAELQAHFQYIGENHPDYEKYRDDGSIIKWIETKPRYLQSGMKEKYSNGNAEEIVELIDDFKAENNIPKITLEQASNITNINKAREAKLKVLTPPVTKRGAVNTTMPATDNFEDAFDEANRKLTQ